MAQSFVIFVGAGLTLLGAFVLMKIPRARNALTLVILAFVVSAASLWFAETVRLLSQPALLGSLLAAGAALIDVRLQRRRPAFTFTAPSAADFAATATSPSSMERVLVGPESAALTTNHQPGEQRAQTASSFALGNDR
jgi:hypothetical protein